VAQRLPNQRQIAESIGIQGATLTHHLNAMEADGVVTRRRDPTNRRVHVVEPPRRARLSSSDYATRPSRSTASCGPASTKWR
jgi:DNA-binding transcriptional MocR family regulator